MVARLVRADGPKRELLLPLGFSFHRVGGNFRIDAGSSAATRRS